MSTAALGACATTHDDGLVVLAAASTRVVNEELEALADAPLTFINAGSAALVQQLADGAPGEVLISADKKTMDDAQNAGLVHDPREVARNTMVIAVPAGNPAAIGGISDLARDNVNLVLCDENVPCGAVARTLLDVNAVAVTPASLENNVTDALGKVTSLSLIHISEPTRRS